MPKIKLSNTFITKLSPPDKTIDYFDSETKGLLLRVYPTGKKVFQIYYRNIDKKQKRFTIAPYGSITLAQSRIIAQEKLGEIAKGVDIQHEKKILSNESLSFKQFLDDFYFKWMQKNRKHNQISINRFNNTFRPLHDILLSDIDKPTVNKFLHDYQNKNQVSDATLNRLLANLKGAITKACEFGYITDNSLRGIKPLKESPSKVRFLSKKETERLFSALDLTKKYISNIVVVAYYTGMRRGELFSLKWSDIDLNLKLIHIDKDISKSGKSRQIPMHSKVEEILKGINGKTKFDYIFKSPVTGSKLDNISKSWHTLMRLAEIDNFRFHDLRHNFASQLVMKGENLSVIRELLGHSDFKMTLRYAHLAPEHKQKAINLL